MVATFKLIDGDNVVFYEIEIIREIENSLILQLKHFGPDQPLSKQELNI